jgi:23S rRNA (cytosine1962-C5)-methyltransferase
LFVSREDALTDSIPIITVTYRGAARLRGGHLWVYRSDLVPPADAPAGSLVHVRDERGRRLGSALYSSASQIAVRLLSSDEISEAHSQRSCGSALPLQFAFAHKSRARPMPIA